MADKLNLWNASYEASPANTDMIGTGNEEFQVLKQAVQERMVQEHEMNIAESGSQPRQGFHKQGSARVYVGTSAPTLLPDGTTALGASDAGRLWFNTTNNTLQEWSGSAWVPISGITTATASTLMGRDASGRSQVADPSEAADIATKGYVDARYVCAYNSTSYTNTSSTYTMPAMGIGTYAAAKIYAARTTDGSTTITLRTPSGGSYLILSALSGSSSSPYLIVTLPPAGATMTLAGSTNIAAAVASRNSGGEPFNYSATCFALIMRVS